MRRTHIILILSLIPIMIQACIPTTVISYTTYNANRYHLGRTLGVGKVHVTGSVGTASIIRSEAAIDANTFTQSGGIETTLNGGDGTYFTELTFGILKRTDLSLGLGGGGGSTIWNFAVQQQLTKPDQPFALSIAPGYTYVKGTRDHVESAEINSMLKSLELRVPMSYRVHPKIDFLWSAGWLNFHQRADYQNANLDESRGQNWSTLLLSAGMRVGFLTFEASNYSWGGHRVTTLGGAFRFHL